MKCLVIGGTGTVGTQVVRALLERQVDVRVMTRAPEAVRGAQPDAEYVGGDLRDPDSLPPVFAGIDRLYLLTPLDPDETAQGEAALEAAVTSGVERIVLQSIHDVDKAPQVPHFRTKIEIAERLRACGIPWTLISPNNFFQNDLLLRQPLTELGVYPQPLGSVGLSRVDVRDIGEAAAVVLSQDGHHGRTYALVGPDVLTGEGTAAVWARHLGRDVRYGGDDLDAWAVQARTMMPDWLVEDLKVMYAFFQERGLVASAEDLAALTALLGRPPRSFETFAAETAATWRDQA
ncbi:MAG: NmrA family NAD(P)-binding protein [Chromatiales bacterium]